MSDPWQKEQDTLAAVVDERTFVAFLRHLSNERMSLEAAAQRGEATSGFLSGLGDWEYNSIGGFLDAAAAAAEDRAKAGIPWEEQDNPWRRAARIILLGKYYE